MQNDSWIRGKVCLITGANTGVGKETAKQLAALGAHIIMVCRNQEKGEEAKEEIILSTKNNNIELHKYTGQIEYEILTGLSHRNERIFVKTVQ